ncbi:hypothetical protein GQ53DRAFT_740608 [Thozetella sp. PMI_491]|nr:hypothetical protein GQ53DRAFT_740608 [Thozetella sp. PMI_491]
MQPPHSDRLLTREIDQLQALENELLGLDKFKGGDSEYITVITHSDEYAGSVSLFQATFSDGHELIKLDRVAMMTDVPKQICRMLRQEAGPSKYELSRAGSKLKCLTSGGLPRPCIARVSTQAGPWPTTGRGWRSALQIPLYNPRYTTGEGLIATVPQMMAFLHLRFLSATDVWSSQALAFEGPLAIGGSSIRRGVRLAGSPRGFPHVGKHTKIAVLFPADGTWAQEQFFWA